MSEASGKSTLGGVDGGYHYWKEQVATARQQISINKQSEPQQASTATSNMDNSHDGSDHSLQQQHVEMGLKEWVDQLCSTQYKHAVQSLADAVVVVVLPLTPENEQQQAEASTFTTNKERILTIRTILRFLVVTLSLRAPHYRSKLQESLLFCQSSSSSSSLLLDTLARLLGNGFDEASKTSNKDSIDDDKSRLTACRLLTNLVTQNSTTSRYVLQFWDWQPDSSEWQQRLAKSVMAKTTTTTTENEKEASSSLFRNNDALSLPSRHYFWSDILLSIATRDRSALAALVACWYNAFQACQKNENSIDNESLENNNNDIALVADGLASSGLVVANLLRHLLPSTAALSSKKQIIHEQAQSTIPPRNDNEDYADDNIHHDDATEWISLLLSFLFESGHVAKLYQAATGRNITDQSSSTTTPTMSVSFLMHIVPEQLILLQLLLSRVEEDKYLTCLGDKAECFYSSIQFLAKDLYQSLRRTLAEESSITENAQDNTQNSTASFPCSSLQETTRSLGPTALSILREILADVLVHAGDVGFSEESRSSMTRAKDVREMLGIDASIMTVFIQDLAERYDQVQARFVGRPAKDIVLTKEEQRIFVSLVRLLGNMCFECPVHQACLRETVVPVPGEKQKQSGKPPSRGMNETDSTTPDHIIDRTGLHILLSCTSLSQTCFTLREWSVIAIRNALHENADNQAFVAELQAQQPASSAPLHEMGVQMELNKNGKVSLKPIDEEDKRE